MDRNIQESIIITKNLGLKRTIYIIYAHISH
jgi:hypothetical protein